MAQLCVNVDHVATLRQARQTTNYPSPVSAALLAEKAGAVGIVAHLREDRRHIQNDDIIALRKQITTKLNLEMAPTLEIQEMALTLKPNLVTLVPEKRLELTTEGGLDVVAKCAYLKSYIEHFKKAKIIVSLFIDPDENQIRKSFEIGADGIEISTGKYSEAHDLDQQKSELKKIATSVRIAESYNGFIAAGHGLHYDNIKPLLAFSQITEYNIGHSIVSRAIMVGFPTAVREMVDLIKGNV